jgi:prefoldin subunit 5
MGASSSEPHWEAELRMLRQELSELRTEQQELIRSVNQLATTFRTLATHLGIAAEPYNRKEARDSQQNLPGFG